MPWKRRRRTRSAICASGVVTMPPSAVVRFFAGWKLKQAVFAPAPIRRPRYSVPAACAASSITTSPCWRSSAAKPSRSHAWPAKWTGRIARVRGVSAASADAGVSWSVPGSTSANTGRAPTSSTQFAVAGQVIGVVTTSSPGPIPCARSARWSAAVHDETAAACSLPT